MKNKNNCKHNKGVREDSWIENRVNCKECGEAVIRKNGKWIAKNKNAR